MENLIEQRKIRFGAYEGALVFVLAILANLLVQGIASFFIAILQGAYGDKGIPFFATLNLIFMVLIQAAFCVVYYFFIIKKKQRILIAPVIHKTKNSKLTLALAPVLAVASLCAFYPLAMLFATLLEKTGYKSSGAIEFVSAFDHVLAVLVLVIMAPIFEELIFRGALLSGLKRKLCVHKSVLLSALAFMLMHMNPDQTVYQFLLGVVMGYAAVYSKTVIVPIIIHAVSNLLAYLLEVTALGTAVGGFIDATAQNTGVGVVVAIGFVVVFSAVILGILILIKRMNGDILDVEPEFEAESEPKIKVLVFEEEGQILDDEHEQEGNGNAAVNEEATITNIKTVTVATNSAKRRESKEFKPLYLIGLGLCVFMWCLGLLIGYVGDDINDFIARNERTNDYAIVCQVDGD